MYFDHGVNLSAVKKLLIYFLQKHTGKTRLEKGSSFYMDVSKNSDTPKSSIFNGVFHYFNHPCWGTSICIFGNTHIFLPISKRASFHRPNGTRTKKKSPAQVARRRQWYRLRDLPSLHIFFKKKNAIWKHPSRCPPVVSGKVIFWTEWGSQQDLHESTHLNASVRDDWIALEMTGLLLRNSTLPETNSEFTPKNGWLEYYVPIGFRPIFRCYVSFREGNWNQLNQLNSANLAMAWSAKKLKKSDQINWKDMHQNLKGHPDPLLGPFWYTP